MIDPIVVQLFKKVVHVFEVFEPHPDRPDIYHAKRWFFQKRSRGYGLKQNYFHVKEFEPEYATTFTLKEPEFTRLNG